MPGPRPTPDHVKQIRKTLRPDRARHQAVVEDGVVEPPVGLPLDAVLVWHELARPLSAGLLRPVDSAMFAQFSVMVAHCRQLWPFGEAPPASYIGQMRMLAQTFGCAGEASRVLARKRQPVEVNPFAKNGARAPKGSGGVKLLGTMLTETAGLAELRVSVTMRPFGANALWG
jgi:hypothetical protein